MIELSTVSYESSQKELAAVVVKLNRKENLSTIFCSELVAHALKVMKLLPERASASNFLPRDFSSHERMDGKDISLLRGCKYAREVRIRWKPMEGTEKDEPPVSWMEMSEAEEEVEGGGDYCSAADLAEDVEECDPDRADEDEEGNDESATADDTEIPPHPVDVGPVPARPAPAPPMVPRE